jgi:hypothetical protein
VLTGKVDQLAANLSRTHEVDFRNVAAAVSTMCANFEKDMQEQQAEWREAFLALFEKASVKRLLDKLERLQPSVDKSALPSRQLARPAPQVQAKLAPVRQAVMATSGSSDGEGPSRMQRAMLTALAQHPEGLTKKKIRIHTGYADSGPVSTSFARLIESGWAVTAGDRLRLTNEGLSVLGPFDPLPLGDELRAHLLNGNGLSTMEKKLLEVVCAAYPRDISKGEARELAGYADSGPVSSAFAALVGRDYVRAIGKGRLIAADELFS